MDEDSTFKTKFIDPVLNILNNFGVLFYYLINRMINKDNEKGIFFAKMITSTMGTEYNRQINFNAIKNVFPIRKKRVKYKTIW